MSEMSLVFRRLLMQLSAWTVVALLASLGLFQTILADNQTPTQPIDLMLIIDNSCSMYEPGNQTCGSNALGSDPGFLRVTGASLFAARMAFGHSNAQDRIGAISMGTSSRVLYEISPIEESRAALAVAVDQPTPTGGTQVVDALHLAYSELSQKSDPSHKPAIVFLTDGVPVPSEGQSFADIEQLVKAHDQIPLYVLLLQNQSDRIPQDMVTKYRAYIADWKQFQQRATNVQVYEVPNDEELLLIYNRVMADIVGGPRSLPPITLQPGQSKEFYVSRFAQRIYITAIHPDKEHRGRINIVDQAGQPLVIGEPGVEVFVDKDNPVEVYSAFGPRLTNQTEGTWKVTSIDATLSFFVDQKGAYRFDWLSPSATAESLPGVLSLQKTNPSQTIFGRFRLVDDQGLPILDQQAISGQVTAPDMTTSDLKIAPGFAPDAQGIYTLTLRLADYGTTSSHGRFEVSLRSDDPAQTGPAQAIAVLTLWIEADPTLPIPTPVTPTPLPPTATPTPTPTHVPAPTLPPPTPTPCPNPPLCKTTEEIILWAVLAVVAVVAIVYMLLRLVRRPPRGFVVVVEDGQPHPPRSLQSVAGGKFWGWWQLTVGPQGDLRIRPSLEADGGAGPVALPGGAGEEARVNIPGVGESIVSPGSTEPLGGKKKAKASAKRLKILGRFINDRGKTRFINQYNRGTTVLTADSIQTVSFGNVQLRMCLEREKLV